MACIFLQAIWDPRLAFTGTTILGVNPENGQSPHAVLSYAYWLDIMCMLFQSWHLPRHLWLKKSRWRDAWCQQRCWQSPKHVEADTFGPSMSCAALLVLCNAEFVHIGRCELLFHVIMQCCCCCCVDQYARCCGISMIGCDLTAAWVLLPLRCHQLAVGSQASLTSMWTHGIPMRITASSASRGSCLSSSKSGTSASPATYPPLSSAS